MTSIKAFTIWEFQPQGKFLARHRSATQLSLFSCCTNPQIEEISVPQPTKYKPSQCKISIRKITKRVTYPIDQRGYPSRTPMQTTPTDLSRVSPSKRDSYTKTSVISEHRRSDIYNRFPPNTPHKIQFTYNNTDHSQDGSIRNYNTTNVIVGECIINPEEVSVFVDRKPIARMQSMQKIEREFSEVLDLGDQFSEDQHMNSPYKTTGEEFHFSSIQNLPKETSKPTPTMANFSFGNQQKTLFMNKYLNFHREDPEPLQEQSFQQYQSKHFSNDSLQQLPRRGTSFMSKSENQLMLFRDTFNRKDMSRLVRKAETINQDIVISDSSQSEGIEDFRSILDRMEIKKREESRYTIHYI